MPEEVKDPKDFKEVGKVSNITNGGILLQKDEHDAVSGFYYDQQLKNRSLIITLHPNMKFDPTATDPDKYWTAYADEGGSAKTNDQTDTTDKPGESKTPAYRIEPLVTCIIPEDFQVGVANNWQDQSMGNDIESLWGSIKPITPYMSYATKYIKEAAREGAENIAKNGDAEDSWPSIMNKIMTKLGELGEKGTGYLNRALVMQGSRFSYYNGTGVAFGNMNLKFTYFSDWDEDGNFRSCVDRLKDLIPYCVGKYVTWDGKPVNDKDADSLNQFVGWQIPPGGFEADVKSVDNIQKGTLMAVIGTMYCIKNLVIQDAQFNFSKQLMKCPTPSGTLVTYPMYCDVQLTLKPASKYTDVSLSAAVEGNDVVTKRYRSEFDSDVNKRLNDLRKKINQCNK